MYEKYATIDIVTVETASFQGLVRNSRMLDVIHDYESRYYRIMEQAQRDLQRYRQGRSQRASRLGLEPEKPCTGLAGRRGFLLRAGSEKAFSQPLVLAPLSPHPPPFGPPISLPPIAA